MSSLKNIFMQIEQIKRKKQNGIFKIPKFPFVSLWFK